MKNDGFSGKIGYILAASGSAVGLGNIWRFPYCAAKFGGGIFLLTYLILLVTFGYTLLIAENCLGRMTGKGPIGTYRDFCSGKSGFLRHISIGGAVNALVPLVIVPYYCVIGGWVTKYLWAFCTTDVQSIGADSKVSGAYFGNFVGATWEPLLFFLIFVAVLAAVVALGVEKGVERFNKILMPVLVVLVLIIAVYCCFLPEAGDGLKYYLQPDVSKFSYKTVVSAMGQLFFSLSIGMGIMITYGSYMKKNDDLVSNINHVCFFDTLVAFMAGLMIIPAVVSFGGRAAAESAGPSLVFVTMPQVFARFPCGQAVGIAFFLLVLFAAATSAISLLETNVQTLSQELKISRNRALVTGVLEIVVVGIITILGYSVWKNVRPIFFIENCAQMDILDSLDFLSNNLLMPIGAIFTAMLVVAVIGLERFCGEVRKTTPHWLREYVFQFCMTVIVIPCLLVILLDTTGILK